MAPHLTLQVEVGDNFGYAVRVPASAAVRVSSASGPATASLAAANVQQINAAGSSIGVSNGGDLRKRDRPLPEQEQRRDIVGVRLPQQVQVAVVGISCGGGVALMATQARDGGKYRGSHSDARVLAAAPGSRRREELEADKQEACFTLIWLKQRHYDWYNSMGGETCVCGSALDGAIEHGLMLQGKAYLYKSRLTVLRYGRWGAANSAMMAGGSPYPPSPALVNRYSAGNSAQHRRLDLRLVAVRVVQSYLAAAGRPWQEALPKECGVLPSFAFLRTRAAHSCAGASSGASAAAASAADAPPQ